MLRNKVLVVPKVGNGDSDQRSIMPKGAISVVSFFFQGPYWRIWPIRWICAVLRVLETHAQAIAKMTAIPLSQKPLGSNFWVAWSLRQNWIAYFFLFEEVRSEISEVLEFRTRKLPNGLSPILVSRAVVFATCGKDYGHKSSTHQFRITSIPQLTRSLTCWGSSMILRVLSWMSLPNVTQTTLCERSLQNTRWTYLCIGEPATQCPMRPSSLPPKTIHSQAAHLICAMQLSQRQEGRLQGIMKYL